MNDPASSHRCWAEIDLAALERNLRRIRATLPAPMRYVAVVKADAYGHGLHQVAARLMHAGADLFAVANLVEARALRELGSGWPILVLSPLLPFEDQAAVELEVALTVSSAAEVARFEAAAARRERTLDVHLKIDTGMGRVGVWHPEAGEVYAAIRAAAHLRLGGIYTHFASPDDDPAFTGRQRRDFLAALDQCPGWADDSPLIHADNSTGLETIESGGPFNAVRVGLLQFGVLPHPHSLLAQVHAEPVFSFHTRIGLVKHLPAGTGISYGRTHRLTRPSRVAVLTAGYGDGIPRALSNRGRVLIHSQACPILGRVTMDQTIVDVTDVPGELTPGEPAVLVGRQGEAEIDLTKIGRAHV
jgi:alanine racemase